MIMGIKVKLELDFPDILRGLDDTILGKMWGMEKYRHRWGDFYKEIQYLVLTSGYHDVMISEHIAHGEGGCPRAFYNLLEEHLIPYVRQHVKNGILMEE